MNACAAAPAALPAAVSPRVRALRPRRERECRGLLPAADTDTDRGREPFQTAGLAPEQHRDILVRVGGFSACFVDLEPAFREDLIRRTEPAVRAQGLPVTLTIEPSTRRAVPC